MISAIDRAAPNHIIANCGCVMCVFFIRPPCQEVIEKAEFQKRNSAINPLCSLRWHYPNQVMG